MVMLQMIWQQQHLRRRRGAPPLGLKNLGNTCYLNSVLQCLSYTPPLAQFCLSSQHSSLCKTVGAGRERGECPFCILERQIARCQSLDGPLDAPSKIQKCITLFAEHFRWGRQEDAHEFLRYVIDACHNTCLKLLKSLGATAATNGLSKVVSQDGAAGTCTVMRDIFGGALLSQVKCLSCKAESNKTDEIMDISLDLFQISSLKDALGRFFQPEVLDGVNKYSCASCKKLSVARKQMFVLRAPNVLVIQLKRFEGINGGKIIRNIEFEEFLVLSKYMYDASQDSQPEYNLFGSIVHSGFSPESGHYYAYIKDASGRWYCCNDAHVKLSSTKEVLSEQVYILFYIRRNQSTRSCKSGIHSNGMKPSDSNGSGICSYQKSAEHKPSELLKPQTLKPNGALPSKSKESTMLKNGKVATSPKVQSISLKSFEIARFVANGNDNNVAHHNTPLKRSGEFEQSRADKKNKIGSVDKSMAGAKHAAKVETSSASNVSFAGESVSSITAECEIKTTSEDPKVNASIHQLNAEVHEANGTDSLNAVEGQAECHNSSSNMISKYNSSTPALQRITLDNNIAEVEAERSKTSCSLSGDDVSGKKHSSCLENQFADDLQQFKEVLEREVRCDLEASGWVDSVHSFMCSRKRLCTPTAGILPDNIALKKQLIMDAKKSLISQFPEALKEHLIDRLRSFYRGRC